MKKADGMENRNWKNKKEAMNGLGNEAKKNKKAKEAIKEKALISNK